MPESINTCLYYTKAYKHINVSSALGLRQQQLVTSLPDLGHFDQPLIYDCLEIFHKNIFNQSYPAKSDTTPDIINNKGIYKYNTMIA